MQEYTYNQDFEYTHDNPYHDKLEEFSDFILRRSNLFKWNFADVRSELYRHKWSKQTLNNKPFSTL